MSLKELKTIVPPPKVPFDVGDKAQWRSIEKQMGTRLPKDYYDCVTTYGSGSFSDVGRLALFVYNPFLSEEYLETIHMHSSILEAFRAGEGDDYIPYKIFPEPGGLLSWGSDVNGNEGYWLTEGVPSRWRIVLRSRADEIEEFGGPLTSFLVKAFTRQIATKIWPEPFFSDSSNIRFEPEQYQVPPEKENIYWLYVENGNHAEFWVRADYHSPPYRYFIRLIGGKSDGPLPGTPYENYRLPVVADLYSNDQLVEKDITISFADRAVFVRL